MDTSATCSIVNNNLILDNPFGTSNYMAGGVLDFVLNPGGNNPPVVEDAGPFSITTYATISGTNYLIDTGIMTNVFTPTPSILTA